MSDVYYGIYGYYLSSTSVADAPSEITNNMINAGYYGLNVFYSDSVGVYHNTAVGGYAGVRDYYNAQTSTSVITSLQVVRMHCTTTTLAHSVITTCTTAQVLT